MWGKELSTFSGNWELTVFIANSRCEISSIPASEIGRLPYEVSVRRVIVPIPVVRVTRNIALNKLAWFYLTAVVALVPSLRLGSPSHLRVPS